MTKAQAAETLKIHKDMSFLRRGNPVIAQALDKAIEVLSDKTEYVKRSTYRKLKAEFDYQEKCYQQLMGDASELRQELGELKGRNLLERIINKDL
jgi:hypothetical protein